MFKYQFTIFSFLIARQILQTRLWTLEVRVQRHQSGNVPSPRAQPQRALRPQAQLKVLAGLPGHTHGDMRSAVYPVPQ